MEMSAIMAKPRVNPGQLRRLAFGVPAPLCDRGFPHPHSCTGIRRETVRSAFRRPWRRPRLRSGTGRPGTMIFHPGNDKEHPSRLKTIDTRTCRVTPSGH
jgi:hypothetical protein